MTLAGEDASSLRPLKQPSKARNGQKSRVFGPDQNIVGQRGENRPFVAGVEVGKDLVIAL